MPGAAGEFVGGIAMSVIFALLGSYLISHTLIAGLAGRFSIDGKHDAWYQHGISMPLLSHYFQASLRFALNRPIISAIAIGVIPALGFFASSKMTEQFFPHQTEICSRLRFTLLLMSALKIHSIKYN